MKIGVACDHAGFEYKEQLKKYISSKSNEITDFGCYSLESVDYPDFAHKLAESIEKGENNLGIQFCGTGNGINMSSNKHQGIRAALCWSPHRKKKITPSRECRDTSTTLWLSKVPLWTTRWT